MSGPSSAARAQLDKLFMELYFHELDRREKLNQRLSIPLGILVVLYGVLGYMMDGVLRQSLSAAVVMFYSFFALAVIFILVATYYFFMSWYNYPYELLPSALHLDHYWEQLEKTYKKYPQAGQLVANQMEHEIATYFVECSSTNAALNNTRSEKMHKTALYLIISVVTSLVSIAFHRLALLQQCALP